MSEDFSGLQGLKKGSRLGIAVLAITLLLGFAIRLYDLKDPPLDFFASRQLRSYLIARADYYRLNPAVSPEMRQKAIELAELEDYEPPILEQIVGLTYLAVGVEQFWIARIYQALFWLVGGIILFGLARRYTGFWASLLGLAFYLFLPFSVIASRSFQPDPWMVMWILLTAYAFIRWSDKPSWKWAIIAGLIGGMTVLVKVFAIFYVGGMLAAIILSTVGIRRLLHTFQPWAMALIIGVPSLIFYLLLNPQRSSDFFSFWSVSLSSLVLQHTFYADWLAMITGLMGLSVFMAALLGVLLAPGRFRWLLVGGWAGYVLFGLFSPYQYTTHEYYHLALIALVGLSLPPLLDVVIKFLSQQSQIWRLAGIGIFVFAAGYSLWVARSVLYAQNYANEPASWRNVGEALPANSKVVGLTADYGMRLRYYGWRALSASWPATADLKLFSLHGNKPIDYQTYFDENVEGKDYFLVTALSEFDAQPQLKELLSDHYPIFFQGSGFFIYDLDHPIKK
jgi:4-amino-4-deoxy-L-arabinose transferase-like glycosyltransferase